MMIKKAVFLFFFCFLSFVSISELISDERVENIEIYLVLDKSLSMVEEIEAVKEYVMGQILDKIVIYGDYFILIPFYGSTDDSFNGFISSNKDLETLKNNVKNLNADGRFTDIGNALDTLRNKIRSDNESVRKYMLLITDGKQEAPPESPFYSPDGTFNHAFLQNTKEIQKSGWKIVVLGIGTETAAREIAKELSAGYSVVSDSADSKDIEESINNFLGRLEVSSFHDAIKIDKNGNTVLSMEVTSTGYEVPRDIMVLEIQLVSDNAKGTNILKEPFEFRVESGEASEFMIPVVLPFNEEDYEADLIFIFGGENAFTPAIHHVFVSTSSGIPVVVYYLLIAVVVIIIIFYVIRIVQRKRMEDEDKPDGAV